MDEAGDGEYWCYGSDGGYGWGVRNIWMECKWLIWVGVRMVDVEGCVIDGECNFEMGVGTNVGRFKNGGVLYLL